MAKIELCSVAIMKITVMEIIIGPNGCKGANPLYFSIIFEEFD